MYKFAQTLKRKAMKVEVNNTEKNEEIKFPCLMIYKPTNLIILMQENLSGTVLSKGLSLWRDGEYSDDFGLSLKKSNPSKEV